jgi:hypothetical protein
VCASLERIGKDSSLEEKTLGERQQATLQVPIRLRAEYALRIIPVVEKTSRSKAVFCSPT